MRLTDNKQQLFTISSVQCLSKIAKDRATALHPDYFQFGRVQERYQRGFHGTADGAGTHREYGRRISAEIRSTNDEIKIFLPRDMIKSYVRASGWRPFRSVKWIERSDH
jgi:hypothetical protein